MGLSIDILMHPLSGMLCFLNATNALACVNLFSEMQPELAQCNQLQTPKD